MEGCNSRQVPSVRNCFLSISCYLISLYLISLRRMKNILLIFLICISSLANAQSNRQRLEDLEDKLDMMRAEQDYKDAQRRIEQQNQRSIPKRSDLSQNDSLIKRTDKILINNQDSTVAISNESIKVISKGLIQFTLIYEYVRPRYFDNRVWFTYANIILINCKKQENAQLGGLYFNKEFEVISEEKFNVIFSSFSQSIQHQKKSLTAQYYNYLCQ